MPYYYANQAAFHADRAARRARALLSAHLWKAVFAVLALLTAVNMLLLKTGRLDRFIFPVLKDFLEAEIDFTDRTSCFMGCLAVATFYTFIAAYAAGAFAALIVLFQHLLSGAPGAWIRKRDSIWTQMEEEGIIFSEKKKEEMAAEYRRKELEEIERLKSNINYKPGRRPDFVEPYYRKERGVRFE